MSSSQHKAEIYRVLIHPAMSIAIATTSVLSLIWLVNVNIGVAAPRAGTIAAVLLAPILEAVVGNILFRERAGIGNRVRELVLFLAVLYAVFSAVRGGPFGRRFEPSADQILPMLAATVAWLIAFVFHNRLRGREALLRSFHGLHGAELRHAVLERQHEMAITVRAMRKARGLIGGLFVTLCMLAVLATLDPLDVSVLRPGSGAFAMLVLYGIASIVIIGSLNAFIEEYAANGEGLAVPLRLQRRRSVLAAVLIVAVLVLAFALSRAQAILPIEAIGDFFRWLAGLFESDRLPAEAPPFQPPPPDQTLPDVSEMFGELEPTEPPLWIRIVAELLARVARTALIVGGLALLVAPLFSANFRRALKSFKPRQFIVELFRNLRRRLRILARFLRHGLRGRRRGEAAGEDPDDRSPDAWREKQWKPTLRKRMQMDHVVQVFVSVTRWGHKHGLDYHRSEAAREYLRRVAELRPEHYADAVFVAETFCEARFSRHLVPRAKMREYGQAAKRIAGSD
ncbi:MAG: DUF4129 domain-containing protein [Spirochaetota bacterium]